MPGQKLELLTARPFIKENTKSEMHFSLPCGSLINPYICSILNNKYLHQRGQFWSISLELRFYVISKNVIRNPAFCLFININIKGVGQLHIHSG